MHLLGIFEACPSGCYAAPSNLEWQRTTTLYNITESAFWTSLRFLGAR